MRNDFRTSCVGTLCKIWSTQKTTDRIRVFSNVFFAIVAIGIVSACVIFEIPYNVLTDIVNEYETKT